MTALTRAFEDNPPSVSVQAFYELAENYPHELASVIYELASAGDLSSCKAAVESGVVRETSGAALAFAMLPLKEKHPEGESISSAWIQHSGRAEKAGEALLQTRDPLQATRLIRYGAKLDAENSNGQNALLFAISQQNAEMVRAILHACNEVDLEPQADRPIRGRIIYNGPGFGPVESVPVSLINIFDFLLRRSMSDAALAMIFDALPAIEEMKPTFRRFAGHAVRTFAREQLVGLPNGEKAAPITEKTREIARRLMEFADLGGSSAWAESFEAYGVFSSTDFLENLDQQIQIFENMLSTGVDVNHVFDSIITTGFDSAGVRKLVKGTFLHFAAAQNNPDLLKANLEAGADVTLMASGRTVAHFLAKSERARDAFEAWQSTQEAAMTAKQHAIADILYRKDGAPVAARVPAEKPAAQLDNGTSVDFSDPEHADAPAAHQVSTAPESAPADPAPPERSADDAPVAPPDSAAPAAAPAGLEEAEADAPAETGGQDGQDGQSADAPATSTSAPAAAPGGGGKKGFGFKRG
jgi:ankyrin repeat protein